MSGVLLAAILAAAQQPPAPVARPYGNLVFARARLAGWSMEATTVFANYPTGPVIDRMLCEAKRDGLRVMTWRYGDLAFFFETLAPRTDRRQRPQWRQADRLIIDDVAYEVERRPSGALTDRYTDVAYPESQTFYLPSEHFYSVAIWREGSPFRLGTTNIANELIEARRLRVGFRIAGGPSLRWIDVPVTALPAALRWCREAMASPAALRFRQP